MLREIVEVDLVMRQNEGAAGMKSAGDVPGRPLHVSCRKIIDEFGHDDGVVCLAREAGRDGQPDRSRSRGTGRQDRFDESHPGPGGFGCVQPERTWCDGVAVRSVASRDFQNPPPRTRPHRVEDRRALHRLVAIAEGPPWVWIGGEGAFEARERDRLHRRASMNRSCGPLNAAIWREDMEKPSGSSVMRPACVR